MIYMQCPHELKIEILTWVGLEPGTLDYETIVLPFCHRGHFKEFKPRVSYTPRCARVQVPSKLKI